MQIKIITVLPAVELQIKVVNCQFIQRQFCFCIRMNGAGAGWHGKRHLNWIFCSMHCIYRSYNRTYHSNWWCMMLHATGLVALAVPLRAVCDMRYEEKSQNRYCIVKVTIMHLHIATAHENSDAMFLSIDHSQSGWICLFDFYIFKCVLFLSNFSWVTWDVFNWNSFGFQTCFMIALITL